MLAYHPHPQYPMAMALIDFWSVLDIKLKKLTRPTESVIKEKLGLIASFILEHIEILQTAQIPAPTFTDI
jgi:hypothetical protein